MNRSQLFVRLGLVLLALCAGPQGLASGVGDDVVETSSSSEGVESTSPFLVRHSKNFGKDEGKPPRRDSLTEPESQKSPRRGSFTSRKSLSLKRLPRVFRNSSEQLSEQFQQLFGHRSNRRSFDSNDGPNLGDGSESSATSPRARTRRRRSTSLLKFRSQGNSRASGSTSPTTAPRARSPRSKSGLASSLPSSSNSSPQTERAACDELHLPSQDSNDESMLSDGSDSSATSPQASRRGKKLRLRLGRSSSRARASTSPTNPRAQTPRSELGSSPGSSNSSPQTERASRKKSKTIEELLDLLDQVIFQLHYLNPDRSALLSGSADDTPLPPKICRDFFYLRQDGQNRDIHGFVGGAKGSTRPSVRLLFKVTIPPCRSSVSIAGILNLRHLVLGFDLPLGKVKAALNRKSVELLDFTILQEGKTPFYPQYRQYDLLAQEWASKLSEENVSRTGHVDKVTLRIEGELSTYLQNIKMKVLLGSPGTLETQNQTDPTFELMEPTEDYP